MRIEPISVKALRIVDAPTLDPITVILRDLGKGQGQVMIECYGSCWTAYWGAMGEDVTLRQFLVRVDLSYLVDRLQDPIRRNTRRSTEYLAKILVVVRAVLRAEEEEEKARPGSKCESCLGSGTEPCRDCGGSGWDPSLPSAEAQWSEQELETLRARGSAPAELNSIQPKGES